ncbi:MAG: DUF6477 family protein [Paracoccus sp. (in: a-proteobacteria)]|nr:DUF6477 family protein [Paracoccus sp. (in: a-proteobacteria)]
MSFIADHDQFLRLVPAASLRRPKALIRAARAGQGGWCRNRDLPRLLARESAPAGPVALRMLRAAEAAADSARREGRADYDMKRHVLLLIALLAEMRAEAGAQRDGASAGAAILRFTCPGTTRPARPA